MSGFVVLYYPKTTAGSFHWNLLPFFLKLKERFHKCKGEKQDGDVADRGVRLMGSREITTGSSGEPAKISAVDRLSKGFRIWLSRWQSHREDRPEFSIQLLTTGVSDANESTLWAFEVDDDSWSLSELEPITFLLIATFCTAKSLNREAHLPCQC